MTDTIHQLTYSEPPLSRDEILRYAGVKMGGEELSHIISEVLTTVLPGLRYKVVYKEIPIICRGACVDFGFYTAESRSLMTNLSGCDRVVLFAATVGTHIDRAILRYSAISDTKALIAEAVGTERIEALCDTFTEDIRHKYSAMGYKARPRFSPGYGDLPLEMQREIFRQLDPAGKIGLTLNSSLLMSPSKSVTAIIGLERVNGTPC